jgi:hypothetical protein
VPGDQPGANGFWPGTVPSAFPAETMWFAATFDRRRRVGRVIRTLRKRWIVVSDSSHETWARSCDPDTRGQHLPPHMVDQ